MDSNDDNLKSRGQTANKKSLSTYDYFAERVTQT